MKILELIYREILFQSIENKNYRFVQKDLAHLFECSLSTVFHALKNPREMGAVTIGGRFGEVTDIKKLLFYWATVRRLAREIIYETFSPLPLFNIEGQMPPDITYAAFSAYRRRFNDAPADYDHVYVYSGENLQKIKKRFPPIKGRARLTVLRADPFLSRYGPITTVAHTFVDLWNCHHWYAKDFSNALLQRIP